MNDIKKEFEERFGINPHHKESCEKALAKFKSDMRASKGDDGYGTNPYVEIALTFYRYYADITDWIEQKLKEACKEQRENCSKFFDNFPDSTEWRNTKEIRNVILNAPEPEGEIK
jgi:hypothetical protein